MVRNDDAGTRAMRANHALVFSGIALFAFVFLKNAYVNDDAYITFRSIEQLFAGNGPRWNPHERVQVFTSPLWFGLLALFRVVSSDVFANVIVASALCSVATILVIRATLRGTTEWLLAIGLLLCSNAFFDYTSSGLENPLTYLLVALYLYSYRRLDAARTATESRNALHRLALVFGLILVCRHDLVTLVLPPTLYVFWSFRSADGVGRARAAVLALAPVAAWSLFAVAYYGFPFPNTAYAKLTTGLDRTVLLAKGVDYIEASARADFVTPLVILVALGITILSRRPAARFLGCGIITNLAYVVYVGGDFMLGRFLSVAYLTAVVVLFLYGRHVAVPAKVGALFDRVAVRRPAIVGIAVAGLVYMFFFPHTPVKSPFHYQNKSYFGHVTDERGFYFATSSLLGYLTRQDGCCFPSHRWSEEGNTFAASPERLSVQDAIGYYGYFAGTDKIVIDEMGLADPLLARLPVPEGGKWRVGHYLRELPAGYRESVVDDSRGIEDPGIAAYYDKLRTITQGEALFSTNRLRTIIDMNVGRYDGLIDRGRQQNPKAGE